MMSELTRRKFTQASAIALGASQISFAKPNPKKPNFLFIICDQLGLDAISAHGMGVVPSSAERNPSMTPTMGLRAYSNRG